MQKLNKSETQMVREMKALHFGAQDIAEALNAKYATGATKDSIKSFCYRNQVRSYHAPTWTDDEIQLVKEVAQQQRPVEDLIGLGRTANGILAKCCKAKIKLPDSVSEYLRNEVSKAGAVSYDLKLKRAAYLDELFAGSFGRPAAPPRMQQELPLLAEQTKERQSEKVVHAILQGLIVLDPRLNVRDSVITVDLGDGFNATLTLDALRDIISVVKEAPVELQWCEFCGCPCNPEHEETTVGHHYVCISCYVGGPQSDTIRGAARNWNNLQRMVKKQQS